MAPAVAAAAGAPTLSAFRRSGASTQTSRSSVMAPAWAAPAVATATGEGVVGQADARYGAAFRAAFCFLSVKVMICHPTSEKLIGMVTSPSPASITSG